MRSFDEAQERIPTQIERIINRLRAAGEDGVTNAELAQICLRYGARMAELYKKGYVIDIEPIGSGLYKYILKKMPGNIVPITNAEDETMDIIENQYGGYVTSDQLKSILEMKKFHIIRKPNWFKDQLKIN